MDQTKYDKQKLNSYLFGELSDAETETFDELSFTDERFADELKSAENDLIDAYVQGELSGETLTKFEAIYLSTAHRREKIEFARALQKVSAKENSKSEEKGFFASWNLLKNRALQIGFAAAAVLLLLFGAFWFAVLRRDDSGVEIVKQTPTPEINVNRETAVNLENENVNTNINAENTPSAVIENLKNENSLNVNKTENVNRKLPENRDKKTEKPPPTPEKEKVVEPKITVATFFLAPPVRGGGNVPVFTIRKNAERIGVKLELEATEYENYHVTLTNETGDINLWRGNLLKARNNFLNVNFPAKLLNKGFYSLTVSGVNEKGEAEIIANYPFRVEIK